VIAANGRVIGVSDGYKTMAGAQNRIESVKVMLAISSPGDNIHQAAPETKTKFIYTASKNANFAQQIGQSNTGSFILSHCWNDIKLFPNDYSSSPGVHL
jgi:hypothetical protein